MPMWSVRSAHSSRRCRRRCAFSPSPADSGAVTLCLPQDTQTEAFDYPATMFEKRVWQIPRNRADRDALKTAVQWIANSQSPMIIAGGGVQTTEQFIQAANLGPWLTLGLFLFVCFLAGFILDWISILLIFIPVFIPIVKSMGFDPVWFCVLFLIVIQTSYLSPPMAPAIFYLRGIAPPEITIQHMFRGVVPFIVIQALCLAIVAAFPKLVLWLPTVLLGFK
ncbi:TRAP transporter large permease subunit [bacterium]|nr:TRAP transporter large permease subunit [bacterium]